MQKHRGAEDMKQTWDKCAILDWMSFKGSWKNTFSCGFIWNRRFVNETGTLMFSAEDRSEPNLVSDGQEAAARPTHAALLWWTHQYIGSVSGNQNNLTLWTQNKTLLTRFNASFTEDVAAAGHSELWPALPETLVAVEPVHLQSPLCRTQNVHTQNSKTSGPS